MMMQENYLKYLISKSKDFTKIHDIFDIILYGSSIKGKLDARDTDVLIIFKDKALNERSEISQEFKKILNPKIKNMDIKTINIHELFDSNFLARQGILAEGYSLMHDKPFAEILGFKGYSLFTYSLKNLNNTKKTRFTYALIGRDKQGVISKTSSKHLGKGVVMVPAEKSIIFEDFLKKWEIDYNKKICLCI